MIENRRDIVKLGTTILFEGMYEGRECYGIQKDNTSMMAVFDHDDKLFAELVELSPTIQFTDRNMWLFKYKTIKISLARYMYCVYHSIDTSKARSLYVRHKERDYDSVIENCMSDNLYLGSAIVGYDKQKNCLTLTSCKNDFVEVAEPVPFLFDILQSGKVVLSWRTNGRLLCRLRNGFTFQFPDLVYLAYHGYEGVDITMENYEELIIRFSNYKAWNDLTIDHLDTDFHNNLEYNIVLVSRDINSRKGDITARIKEPHCFAIAYAEGYYKMCIGDLEDNGKLGYHLFCSDKIEDVVDMLEAYSKLFPENVLDRDKKGENVGLFTIPVLGRSLACTPLERFQKLYDCN